jgi:hypothetical protein
MQYYRLKYRFLILSKYYENKISKANFGIAENCGEAMVIDKSEWPAKRSPRLRH